MGLADLLEESGVLPEGSNSKFTWRADLHDGDHLFVSVSEVLSTFDARYRGFSWTSHYNLFTNTDPGLHQDGSDEQTEIVGDSKDIVTEWMERSLLGRFPELAWFFNPERRKTALERLDEEFIPHRGPEGGVGLLRNLEADGIRTSWTIPGQLKVWLRPGRKSDDFEGYLEVWLSRADPFDWKRAFQTYGSLSKVTSELENTLLERFPDLRGVLYPPIRSALERVAEGLE